MHTDLWRQIQDIERNLRAVNAGLTSLRSTLAQYSIAPPHTESCPRCGRLPRLIALDEHLAHFPDHAPTRAREASST